MTLVALPSALSAAARVRAVGRQVLDPRTTTPSFGYKAEEAKRLRGVERELGFVHPVWTINDKDAARGWAARMGLRQPALVGEWPRAGAVPWGDLPSSVVVKPVRGAASRGVHLLRRQGSGWRDLGRQRDVSTEAVVGDLDAAAAARRISAAVVAEELVLDARHPAEPPVDWKIVTFFGRIGLVQAKVGDRDRAGRATARWRFFDEDWRDLGAASARRVLDPTIERALHADEVLAMARRVSAAVPWPMLRVDLFDGRDGVVFGEVTPEPGGVQRLRRDLDLQLGSMWEEAEARLRVRAARAGALTPAAAALPESAGALQRTAQP